jgi:hypothetical protein
MNERGDQSVSSTGAAWLRPSGIMPGGLRARQRDQALGEWRTCLGVPPPLCPRCELLIVLPGFTARSDQPHDNEQSEWQGEAKTVAGVSRCAPYIVGEHHFRD